jgi:endonuclease/exonuclease/phosphatase (EEP) superfamily protein YafD
MRERAWRRTQKLLTRTAVAATTALAIATSCAVLAARWWLGDLAVHFRVQYVVIAALCAVMLGLARRFGWAAMALLCLIANAIAVWSIWDRAPSADAAAAVTHASVPARVVALNVLYANVHYGEVVEFLRAAQPDAVVLVEITPRWRRALEDLRGQLPFQYFAAGMLQRRAGPQVRGTLLLSRWPIASVRPIVLGPHAEPAIDATLAIGTHRLQLLGVHTTWPLGWEVSAERNRQLDELAALARTLPRPLVVAGDLNVTPYSPHYGAFLRSAGLRPASPSTLWLPTWPTFLPPAGIQIDHILVSTGVAVAAFARGPGVGSDHRPIEADLRL